MPVKPLNDEQKRDAERLRAIYQARKGELGLSQQAIADRMGFANQSAVSQYFNGRIPLNTPAAIGFATILHCSVGDFSPSIAIAMKNAHRAFSRAADGEGDEAGWQEPSVATLPLPMGASVPPVVLWPFSRIKRERWEALSEGDRGYIEGKLEALIEQAEAAAGQAQNRGAA